MTDVEFQKLVIEIAAEELDKQTREGILPPDTDQQTVQYIFQLHAAVIYQSVMSNPSLKAKLPTTPRSEAEGLIRRLLKEADRTARERLNMPYRQE